jgi:NADPH-dependent ferric siderophore reductase
MNARDLILAMPAALSDKRPNYPTSDTELAEAVANVLAARNFEPELKMYWACGELDALKVARAVLRGLGVDKDEAKSLTRSVSE